jgi:hypothetical protein
VRSKDWLRAIGRTTLGAGVVSASATGALLVTDESPAAAWTQGHCYNFHFSPVSYTGSAFEKDCLSKSQGRYLGTIHNSGPNTVYGHLEVSVYVSGSGWKATNGSNRYLTPGQTISSPITPSYGKNVTHSVRIKYWEALSQNDPLGYWGAFEMANPF